MTPPPTTPRRSAYTLSFVMQAIMHRFSYCISDRDDAGVLLLGHSDLAMAATEETVA